MANDDSSVQTALGDFRSMCVDFLAEHNAAGTACPAFGAILPPDLLEPALRWQRICFDSGFAGVHWPAEYGGGGRTRAHAQIWFTECARADVSPYLNLQGIILAGEAILRSGTEEQKDRYLEATLRGDLLWCQLFSEPGAGSDLASLATSADRDGDEFVVNGQKVWSSNAQFAQAGILLARTDPAARHRGISFFCVDMTLPGIEIRPIRQMTGDEEFCEVFFTDVRLPADSLLGPLNEGWRVAMEVLADERGSFGAAGAISLRRRLDKLSTAASAAAPVDRTAALDLLVKGGALAALLDRLGAEPAMAPAAKLLRTELEVDASQLDHRLGGSVENLLYSPGMRIAGGSSEIQRSIIGERLLGLPREPS